MVPRVAKMRPGKPSRTSFGRSPLWSIWACVSSTASMSAGAKWKGAVVELLQRLLSLKQATVDQEPAGTRFEQMARAGHGAGGAAKAQRDAHTECLRNTCKLSSRCKRDE